MKIVGNKDTQGMKSRPGFERSSILSFLIFTAMLLPASTGYNIGKMEAMLSPASTGYNIGKIEAMHKEDNVCRYYMHEQSIYSDGLDTLQNILFWRKVISLPADSGLVNIAGSRYVVAKIASGAYNCMSDIQRGVFRDSIRQALLLPDSARVLFTLGKREFYRTRDVMFDIDKCIRVFEEENTDPFFAQAILLVESPACLQKSTPGAYGPFQLMKGVARNMGLKGNKNVDERKDLVKSARAASKLIRTICIPYTNAMLDQRGICYNPHDLWYRLLVLHAYHAGAGNVKKALKLIGPCEGNMDLIKQLWSTNAGAFKSASQNYSQIILACMINLDELIQQRCTEISWVQKK